MFHLSVLRSVLPQFIFASAIFVAACGAGTQNQPANTAAPGVPTSTVNQAANNAPKAKLNLNTASEAELLSIPGMTNRMVHEFQEYRPYKSIQEFRKEMAKYVSAAVIADYEKYIYVPISQNGSDAATLQQIPGLDTTEAGALIAARPYASPEDFLAKLGEKVTPDALEVAKTYIR